MLFVLGRELAIQKLVGRREGYQDSFDATEIFERRWSLSQIRRLAPSTPTSQAFCEISGVGIHTGRLHHVGIRSGRPGSGIVFRVKDPRGDCSAPALWTRLSGTTRSTALVLRGSKVKVELRTIEHLMAALMVLGHSDLEIEVTCKEPVGDAFPDVYEIPVLDGSSHQWVQLLKQGLAAAPLLHRGWWLKERVEVNDGDRRVVLEPWGELRTLSCYKVAVDFGEGLRQELGFEMDWSQPALAQARFETCLAPARTFGFKHEVDALRARGLALGAHLENAILIADGKVVNEGGFRLEQELAAHKMVDAIGDFALLGAPLFAKLELHKAGHSMHTRALQEAAESGVLQEVLLMPDGEWKNAP